MAPTPEEIDEKRIKKLETQIKKEEIRREIENLKLGREKEKQLKKELQLGSLLSKQRLNYYAATMNPIGSGQMLKQLTAAGFKSIEDRTRALAFGRTSRDLTKGKEEKFIQGTGGFLKQVESNLQGLEAGFVDLPDSMRELGATMILTNQDSRRMFGAMRKSQVLGGMTNEELSNLAKTVSTNSATYGTKTETIVAALEGVQGELLKFNLLDTAGSFQEGIAIAAAQLGEGSEESLAQFVSEMTTIESLPNQVRLGIEQEVDKFLKSSNPEEQARLLTTIANKAAETTRTFNKTAISGNNLAVQGLAVTEDMFGKLGLMANAMSKIEQRQPRDEADRKKANQTLQTSIDETFSKQQEFLYNGTDSMIDVAVEQRDLLKTLIIAISAAEGLKLASKTYSLGKEGRGILGKVLNKGGKAKAATEAAEAAAEAATEAAEGALEKAAEASGKNVFKAGSLLKNVGKFAKGAFVVGGTIAIVGGIMDLVEKADKKEADRLQSIEDKLKQNQEAANQAKASMIERNLEYDTKRNQLQKIRAQKTFQQADAQKQISKLTDSLQSQANTKEQISELNKSLDLEELKNQGAKNIQQQKARSGNKEVELTTWTGGPDGGDLADFAGGRYSDGTPDFTYAPNGRKRGDVEAADLRNDWEMDQERLELARRQTEATEKIAAQTRPKAETRKTPLTGVRQSE
jgi:hypothetical protein